MAARTAVLVDELVQAITGYSPDNKTRAYKACKDSSLRGLRSQRFGRTNQFNVQNSLNGLVEKFHIFNKEPLADALEERLEELKETKQAKTLPEVLSLLLLLSDRPAENATVEDLELIKAPQAQSTITWQELVADDPLTKDEIWEPPDYASSDDGATPEISEVSQDTTISSIVEPELVSAESLLLPVDHAVFNQLKTDHQWRKQGAEKDITELQVVREVLHMLHGLPSILFEKTSRSKKLVPSHGIKLTGTSNSSVHGLLSTFADAGTIIGSLRAFANKYRKSPLLQTFCAAVQEHLQNFDRILSGFEAGFIEPLTPVVVSLLRIDATVQEHAAPLVSLSQVITNAQTPSLSASLQSPGKVPSLDTQSFRLLDCLCDEICDVQASGRDSVNQVLVDVFFTCLSTYLRPIHDWMQHGNLTEDPDFLIALIQPDERTRPSLATFWFDRYEIRQSLLGKPEAPQFLQPHLPKILGSGKSVAFRRQLGLEPLSIPDTRGDAPRSSASFDMCHAELDILTPFEESFAYHLDIHITSLYQHTSDAIVQHLLYGDSGNGLLHTIAALGTIYFSSDGMLFDAFAREIYDHVSLTTSDAPPSKSIITECAQRNFAEQRDVRPALLSASMEPLPRADGLKLTMSKRLAHININYTVSPSIQNIIVPASSTAMYSNVLTLLLQLRYSLILVRPVVFALPYVPTQRMILQIRHRILHTLMTLEDYLVHLVLAPSEILLNKRLRKAQDVDTLISAYEAFTHDVSAGCFEVGKRTAGVRRIVSALCDLGELFAKEVKRSHNLQSPVSDDEVKEGRQGSSYADAESSDEANEEDSAKDEKAAERPARKGILHAGALPRLKRIRAQATELTSMLVAQLRNASRSGTGQTSHHGLNTGTTDAISEVDRWEMLADRLGWGMPGGTA